MPDAPATILPTTASANERKFDAMLAARYAALNPAILKTLYNPDTAPPEYLGQLGFTLSVDQWDIGWTNLQKRNALRNALHLHRIKGTNAAVLGALADIGISAEIIEWFDNRADAIWDASLRAANGTPAPFTAQITVDSYSGGATREEVEAAIAANKRESVRFVVSLRAIDFTGAIAVRAEGIGETDVRQFVSVVVSDTAPANVPGGVPPTGITLGGSYLTLGGSVLTHGSTQ